MTSPSQWPDAQRIRAALVPRAAQSFGPDDDTWTLDIINADTAKAGEWQVLTVLRDDANMVLGSVVARRIEPSAIVSQLTNLFEAHGKPHRIRTDNGSDWRSATIRAFLSAHEVTTTVPSRRTKPQRSIERFGFATCEALRGDQRCRTILDVQRLVDAQADRFNLAAKDS